MPRLRLLVLLLFFVPLACSKSPTSPTSTSVAGTWSGSASSTVIPGARFNLSANLNQSGTSVTGTLTCTAATASCSFSSANVSGTLNASALSAQLTAQSGGVICGSFNGTLSGSTLSGNYACTTSDAGTWTLNKN